MSLRIGCKVGTMSDNPLNVIARTFGFQPYAEQPFAIQRTALGDCADICVGNAHVVLTSDRQQNCGLELFTGLGIDPEKCYFIVVKSSHQLFAGFSPIAKQVFFVSTPGALQHEIASLLPYRAPGPVL